MGNCQATDAAAIVIQRRGGKAEKIFWPISAGEVMKNNPGFYVALISVSSGKDQSQGSRYTRVRVLRPKDNLLLGQVYRLVTTKGKYVFHTITIFSCSSGGDEKDFKKRFLNEKVIFEDVEVYFFNILWCKQLKFFKINFLVFLSSIDFIFEG